MHLGAVVGAPIVLISDERAPEKYHPLTKELSILRDGKITEISVDAVYDATLSLLKHAGREEKAAEA